MNFIEKLEKYFNSGSTDKQNKRRLGGLLIAITAVLLVLSIVIVTVGGAVSLVISIVDGFKNNGNEGNDGDGGVNSHLAEVTLEDVMVNAAGNKFTLTNNEVTLTETEYTKLQQKNRPETEDGSSKLYRCDNADNFALQNEAFTAFNAMITAFYQKTKLTTIWVKNAYNITGGNVTYFTNALAVKLDYTENYEKSAGSIYGVKEYEWIFDHAHEYGFVRVSDESGEENVFRYVGLAHAKYIQSKQAKKNAETFYGLDAYIAELKASTPDSTIKVSSVKKGIGETATTTYYIYYMPSASEVFKLPNNKYSFTVMDAGDGGYFVVYRKADKT